MIDTDEERITPPDPFPWPPGGPALEALGRTWRRCVTEPARFFAAMPLDGRLAPIVLFQLLMVYAGAGAHLFWSMALPFRPLPETVIAPSRTPLADFLVSGPLTLAVTVLYAGLVQLSLIVLGARQESVGATLRVLLFASAPAVFQVVPLVGWLIATIGTIWISTVGLRVVHRTSGARAFAALVGPFLVLLAIGVALAVLVAVVGVTLGIVAR